MITPDEREIRAALLDVEITLDALASNPRPRPLFTDGPQAIGLGLRRARLLRDLATVRVLTEVAS